VVWSGPVVGRAAVACTVTVVLGGLPWRWSETL
jgi:hypothetical protein